MINMNVIEVVIGLFFIYLLLSLFASIISEIITGLWSLRGRFLRLIIRKFIDDENNDLSTAFLKHPFFHKISPPSQLRWFKKIKLPSYLHKEDFSKIFLESLLAHNTSGPFKVEKISFEKVKSRIINLNEGETKEVLLSVINEAELTENKLRKLRDELEDRYDSIMGRAEGWYKRRAQFFLFFVGLTIAVGFNADTFSITNQLAKNPELRRQMVEMAEKFRANADTVNLQQYYEESIKKKMDPRFVAQLKELSNEDSTKTLKLYSNTLQLQALMNQDLSAAHSLLGLGSFTELRTPAYIRDFWAAMGWWIEKIIGFILTALAISLGAPFWFDLLNKVMEMRSATKPRDIH